MDTRDLLLIHHDCIQRTALVVVSNSILRVITRASGLSSQSHLVAKPVIFLPPHVSSVAPIKTEE